MWIPGACYEMCLTFMRVKFSRELGRVAVPAGVPGGLLGNIISSISNTPWLQYRLPELKMKTWLLEGLNSLTL